jgi:hypothetical protein
MISMWFPVVQYVALFGFVNNGKTPGIRRPVHTKRSYEDISRVTGNRAFFF